MTTLHENSRVLAELICRARGMRVSDRWRTRRYDDNTMNTSDSGMIGLFPVISLNFYESITS